MGDPEKAAELIKAGSKIMPALLEAGYSKAVAKNGRASLRRGDLKKAFGADLKRFMDLGRKVKPEEQEALVRGALLANVQEGKDSAVMSLKLLGQDRSVNMWQPEVQQGIIVLNAPKNFEPTILDAEPAE